MNIQVNTSSSEPIYRQVARQIGLAVARGRLRPGDPLPPVRELARRLVLNPHTIFRAYAELEREGVVVTREREGTFVAEPPAAASGDRARSRLAASVDRVLTDAAHLGVSQEELIQAIAARAKAFRLPDADAGDKRS